MKVIDFTKIKQAREHDQSALISWELVQYFRASLHSNLPFEDGHPEDLRRALNLVSRYWGHPEGLPTGAQENEALRDEVEALRLETRYWLIELVMALRRLAILECPFQELDVIKNEEGTKVWIELIGSFNGKYFIGARKYGKSGRPLKKGEYIELFGEAGIAGWHKVGRLTDRMVQRLGWRPIM